MLHSLFYTLTEQTVAMYCFIDDLLTFCRLRWTPPPDLRRYLSDADVLTTALVAARYFGGLAGLVAASVGMNKRVGAR